jgi:hypothetical protein
VRQQQVVDEEDREERRRLSKLERRGKERRQLEERAEKEADTLRTRLEELLAFDRAHKQALGPFSIRASEPPPPDLARELSSWFRGSFKGVVVPGIGSAVLAPGYGEAGPSLPECDPHTDTKEG